MKKVELGLVGEARFQNTGARCADPFRHRECYVARSSRRILRDRDIGRRPASLLEARAHVLAEHAGRDHHHVYILRRRDEAEMDVVAVGEVEELSGV